MLRDLLDSFLFSSHSIGKDTSRRHLRTFQTANYNDMATDFEAAITKAVADGVVAGAAVFAVGKNGLLLALITYRVLQHG